MHGCRYLAGASLATLLLVAPLAAHANVTLSNPNDGGTIGPIGHSGQADELGQVFTAPVSGTLDSFTFTFQGAVDQFTVGIGEWDGPASYAQGHGVSAIDYQSGVMSMSGPGTVTFDPNVAVTAGLQYVAFVSTYGLAATSSAIPNGLAVSQTPTTDIDYIVFNEGAPGSTPWDYFVTYDPNQIAMSAHITTPAPCNADHPLACGGPGGVPEPAAWALMILGFGGAGTALRRRRSLPAAA